ncbi:NucA/NucB deoxyribonuclease domain-containing protein [Nonomuraea angiospora]|uniref:NucA/NucB deoxyribonuclease domain-containing protein n=1 Tax=Nonomuraea angiospora TaxID=46172 RepID=UPI00332E6DC5
MYDHVKLALDPTKVTNPVPGGATYPDIVSPKNIPGGSPRNPPTRTPYSTDNAANRGAAQEACDKEFGWIPKSEKQGLSCDEFPFAATWQGAAFAKPRHNYSVKLIPKEENVAHGTVLGAWFNNNRIIAWDKFFVKLG